MQYAISIAEAARRLGVHRVTVARAIAAGRIRAARLGRRRLVPVTELDRLLAAKPAASPRDAR